MYLMLKQTKIELLKSIKSIKFFNKLMNDKNNLKSYELHA